MKWLLLAIAFFLSAAARSQQGKKVRQTSFFTDTTSGRKVVFYRIEYLSDGITVRGYLAVPAGTDKLPCIIYNRGGNRDFGAISDESFISKMGWLAREGYVIIASQYREREEFGGADVQDVLSLLNTLNEIPRADTSRIGMFGWSRGGMMTYLALTRTDRIRAAVVGSGVTDLFRLVEARPDFDTMFATMIPGYARHRTESLRERSAFYVADRLCKRTPLLILQGTADWRVPARPVIDFAGKLYEVQHPFRFLLLEGGTHGLAEHRQEVDRAIINWFHTYLRDGAAWPALEPHGE